MSHYPTGASERDISAQFDTRATCADCGGEYDTDDLGSSEIRCTECNEQYIAAQNNTRECADCGAEYDPRNDGATAERCAGCAREFTGK